VKGEKKSAGGVNLPSFSQAATNVRNTDSANATTATTFILKSSSFAAQRLSLKTAFDASF